MADKIKLTVSEINKMSNLFLQDSHELNSILKELTSQKNILRNGWSGESSKAFLDSYEELTKQVEKFVTVIEKKGTQLINVGKAMQQADSSVGAQISGTSSTPKTTEHKQGFIEKAKAAISPGGKYYHAAKIGSSVLKIVGGVTLMATSGVEEFFTGGTATPIAAVQAAYGLNSTANGIRDLYDCYKGDYDEVGKKNFMKDGVSGSLGFVTDKALHDKQIGESVGDVLYDVGDIASNGRGLTELAGIAAAPKYVKIGKLPCEIGKFRNKIKYAYVDYIVAGPSLGERLNSGRKVVSKVKSIISDVVDMKNSALQPSHN
ncbi:WXG100 family type VII secretion target [Clostridium felsineum]|uniref:WXG100 family type VII secretion target n=1 Tax=Clostridium felsineum TaxID=36839 RepID=UPI00214D6B56|nr:WXG100 family type VII secretion target [Clostridium felsineum]MCR3758703.1 WXG100 family type VII secretion target [Clostridium felsineum]